MSSFFSLQRMVKSEKPGLAVRGPGFQTGFGYELVW